MAKIKYYYNKETCSYEVIETTGKVKLLRVALYLLIAGITAVSSLFAYYNYNSTPKEEMLITYREKLDIQWDILKSEIGFINLALTDLYLDDHELREILELNDLPKEIRNAGIGGNDRVTRLRNQNLNKYSFAFCGGFTLDSMRFESQSRVDRDSRESNTVNQVQRDGYQSRENEYSIQSVESQ